MDRKKVNEGLHSKTKKMPTESVKITNQAKIKPRSKMNEREREKERFFTMYNILNRDREQWLEEGIRRGYLTPEGNMVKD